MNHRDDLAQLLVSGDPQAPPANTQALVVALRDVFRSPEYTAPRLPAEALQLVKLSRQPDVSIPEIARHLERDPLLAAKVLRSAQSPLYARGNSLTSLSQALVRLGVATLVEIFLAESLKTRIFRAPGYDRPMAQIRDHCVAVAHFSRIICRQTSFYDEYAFLSGLLHDVGMAACVLAMTERRGPRDVLPPFASVWPAIWITHAEVSASLCDLWGLPPEVVLAVRMHHEATRDPSNKRIHPLAVVIAAADHLALRLGFGIEGEETAHDWTAQQEALQISAGSRSLVEREAEALATKLR